jgi:hypothetical protein
MARVGWEISFRSRVQGPISSGRMTRDAENYAHDVASALADSAKDTWLNNLNSRLRHQTPYYTTRIKKRELTPTRYKIHDSGVVYGHWLEGTGSRNAPVTIFPGYWSRRDAEAEMQRKRANIGRRILRRYRSQGKLI